MIHHPLDRLQRKKIAAKKNKPLDEKKQEAKERPGQVRRKLSLREIREQETADELKEWRP